MDKSGDGWTWKTFPFCQVSTSLENTQSSEKSRTRHVNSPAAVKFDGYSRLRLHIKFLKDNFLMGLT